MKFGPLRWALAIGLSMGLAAAVKSTAPGIEDAGLNALFGAGFALAIALLRPWWMLESSARAFAQWPWLSNLWRRAGDTTLFLRSPLRLAWPLRDALFRAHGWLAGFAFGVAIAETAQSSLARWLFGSRFEGAAMLIGPLLGVLAGAFVALALDRLPRLAAAWHLEGQVDARAAARILEYGAGALLLLVACSMAAVNPSPPTPTTLLGSISETMGMMLSHVRKLVLNWPATHTLLALPLITLAALIGFALPWLLWREQAEYKRSLWLVVLEPDGVGVQRGALTLQLVDALARRWRDGPMTVVLDAALDVGGEQLHAALTLGRERAMFPRIPVELADWGQLLPPQQRWLASPLRELHVPVSLMLAALERFAGAGDKIVLVCRSVEALAAWRDLFRHGDCVVVWHGAATAAAAAGSTIGGFRAIALDELVSSGSLPDVLSTVPTEAPVVQPVLTEPEATNADPTGTMAATDSTQIQGQDARKAQAAEPPAPELRRASPRLAWACLPLLWLLASSYSFGPTSFPLGVYLFVPLAAWWASRFGHAGWPPFATGAATLLISYSAGPLAFGNGAGVFVVSWIVFKLVADPDYRRATLDANLFGTRQLLYVMLVAATTVYAPGSGGPVSIGGFWQPYLILLLLLLGLAGIVPRILPWALVLGLALGIVLRLAPRSGFLSALPNFDFIGIGYSISDPSVLVGALLALYGPAYMGRRRERSDLSAGALEARLANAAAIDRFEVPFPKGVRTGGGAPYLLLAYAFVDVYFGLSLDLGSQRLSVSLVGTSGLLVVAFLVGLHDGRAAMTRIAWMLAALVAVAAGIDLMTGSIATRGVLGWGLRYSVNVLEIAQGAAIVGAYAWLGMQVGARGGTSISLLPTSPAPATLPQLRFAYMDIVLTVAVGALLSLRAGLALYEWLGQTGAKAFFGT